jgi:hypothetical protein
VGDHLLPGENSASFELDPQEPAFEREVRIRLDGNGNAELSIERTQWDLGMCTSGERFHLGEPACHLFKWCIGSRARLQRFRNLGSGDRAVDVRT